MERRSEPSAVAGKDGFGDDRGAEAGVEGWFLDEPDAVENRLRKERKGVMPPFVLDEDELGLGWVGLPLTERCRVGGTRPRWGVEKVLGTEL